MYLPGFSITLFSKIFSKADRIHTSIFVANFFKKQRKREVHNFWKLESRETCGKSISRPKILVSELKKMNIVGKFEKQSSTDSLSQSSRSGDCHMFTMANDWNCIPEENKIIPGNGYTRHSWEQSSRLDFSGEINVMEYLKYGTFPEYIYTTGDKFGAELVISIEKTRQM